MPILTALAADPYQPGFHVLEVDRRRFASLPAEVVTSLRLEPGRTLDARLLARLTRLADIEAAVKTAARALSRRAFATRDLRRRLLQRQHPAAAVDAALVRLAGQGLLDDRRFAVHFAASRAARGRGPARLLRDLLAQGVDRSVAEQAVGDALRDEGVDPLQAARVAARQRARVLRELAPDVRRRRLTAFLVRRGYGGSNLASVVREAVSGA